MFSGYVADQSAHFRSGELEAVLYPNALLLRGLLSFDDWRVVYRQVLQLGRALGGGRQILEVTLPKESFMASVRSNPPIDSATQSLSTRQLLTQLIETVTLLVRKEVELARAEIRADVKAELSMVTLLVAGGVVAVFGMNMLLVAAVFALTVWMPGWLAALAVAVLLLVIGGVIGLVGWQRRVSVPLAVTRKVMKEDVQWAKERLA